MRTPRLTLSLLVAAVALSLGAAPALAAKPRASTDGVTDVTPVGATFLGSIDPRGLASSGFFQYGTTTKYAQRTPSQSAGLNPGLFPLRASVTGLKSDTTYHFRVVGENKDGRTNGKDLVFKTAAPTTTPVFTPNPAPYGDPVIVSGVIVGSGAGGADVSLFGRPFPFTDPFTKFGNTVVADPSGAYQFVLTNALNTAQFQVQAQTNPAFTSSIQTLEVASKISLSVVGKVRRGHKVRFHGLVAPGQDGVVVDIQKRQRSGKYKRFASTTLKHRLDGRSGYSVRKTLRKRGIFRAVVKSPGGAVVGAATGAHSIAVKRH